MGLHHKCQTLIELFNQSVARAELAEKDYLQIIRTDREEHLTFGQLAIRARDFTVYLIQNKNIKAGDRIAVLGKNRADWDIALWGIILAAAVPVLIDPERRIEGVKKHLLHTDTKLLVLADDYQDISCREKLKQFLHHHRVGVVEMTVYDKPTLDSVQITSLMTKVGTVVKGDDTAVILCTSGTTGEPREVEITHTNLIANITGALDVVKITTQDKLGHIMPPHHSFGLTVGKLLPFCVGATNLYTNKYRRIPQLVSDTGITIFVGVPALFISLAGKLIEKIAEQKRKNPLISFADRYLPGLVGKKIVKKLGLSSLRFFISGAAPLPKWVLEAFWKRGLKLREGYGTTENSPIYGINNNPEKLGSVGRPISTMSVKIVNEQNEILAPGQTGEIVLGGPCIAKGYYKNPQATQAVIEKDTNGLRWLHTGDLGYLDEDGYLFITGRRKYLIVLPGGKNVCPEFVELVLSRARYIEELVVVPGYQEGPAGIKQEAVRAIVRPAWRQVEADTKLSRQDLINLPGILKNLIWKSINQCQQDSQELAGFEKITSKNLVEIEINEFQKTSTGKIKRDLYHQPMSR
ncbi:MAG: class I adenylate-forming enzyme family protein [Planctomycetota bacterium]|jgi:long-chain acyl-CoA synthetase